jgi:hypothetical protein
MFPRHSHTRIFVGTVAATYRQSPRSGYVESGSGPAAAVVRWNGGCLHGPFPSEGESGWLDFDAAGTADIYMDVVGRYIFECIGAKTEQAVANFK